jgi:hypothetical protein
MTDITIQVKDLNKGERLGLHREYSDFTPPFLKLGDSMGYNRSAFPAYKDLPETMQTLSKGAHWLFWKLLSARNIDTNIAIFTPRDATETQKVRRAYKELCDAEIIIRLRRSQYMFNPAVLEPKSTHYETVFIKWSTLTSKSKRKTK